MSKKVELFREFLNTFETDELRLFSEDLLEAQDDCNYTIPASTSGKYHNPTQCQPGGQMYHVLFVCKVMEMLLPLEYIQEKFPKPKQRDCLRTAVLFHDAKKTNNGMYTVKEHPMLGAKFVEETEVKHDIPQKLKQYIGRLIQSHSGQWDENGMMPKPESDDQFLIHLCDMVGSRAFFDMRYSEEQKNMIASFQDIPSPDEYTIQFGKYKGKTISWIQEVDESYLLWLRDSADMDLREPLRTILETLD